MLVRLEQSNYIYFWWKIMDVSCRCFKVLLSLPFQKNELI